MKNCIVWYAIGTGISSDGLYYTNWSGGGLWGHKDESQATKLTSDEADRVIKRIHDSWPPQFCKTRTMIKKA